MKEQTTRVLRLDWRTPPLSANDRMHHMKRARITSDVRLTGKVWGSQLPRGADHVEVSLQWFVNDNRRRDADNVVPTLKALCDGLVDAGVVPDDTPQYMTKRMPTIHVVRGIRAHMILSVTLLNVD